MRGVALLVRLAQRTADCGRLMVGMPSYTDYLLHQRSHHPDAMPMNRAEYVRNRQAARFGGGGRGGFRCC